MGFYCFGWLGVFLVKFSVCVCACWVMFVWLAFVWFCSFVCFGACCFVWFLVHYTSGLCSSLTAQGSTTINIINNCCCLPFTAVGPLTPEVTHTLKRFAGATVSQMNRLFLDEFSNLLLKGQRKSLFYFVLNLVNLLNHIIFILSMCTVGIEH